MKIQSIIADAIESLKNVYYLSVEESKFRIQVLKDLETYVFDEKIEKSFILHYDKLGELNAWELSNLTDNLQELDNNEDQIKRLIHACFLIYNEKDIIKWADLGTIFSNYPHYKTFLAENENEFVKKYIKEKFQGISSVAYIKETLKKLAIPLEKLKAFSNLDEHYQDGKSKYVINFYLHFYLMEKIILAVENNEQDKFEKYVYDYLSASLKDHVSNPYQCALNADRVGLDDEQCHLFLAMLLGRVEINQENISAIKEKLSIDVYGEYSILGDDDFNYLHNLLLSDSLIANFPDSNYVKNFSCIFHHLFPVIWIKKRCNFSCITDHLYFYNKYTLDTLSMELEENYAVLNAMILQYPDYRDNFIIFVLTEVVEKYYLQFRSDVCYEPQSFTHNKIVAFIRKLCDDHNLEHVWQIYFNKNCLFTPNPLMHHIIMLAFDLDETHPLQRAYDEYSVTTIANAFSALKNDKEKDEIRLFLLHGEHQRAEEKMEFVYTDCKHFRYLSDAVFERACLLFFNRKNSKYAKEFIQSSINDLSDTPLRRLSNIVIKNPTLTETYLKGCIAFIHDMKLSSENTHCRLGDITYKDVFPHSEFAYLIQNNIDCVSAVTQAPTNMKAAGLLCLKGNIHTVEDGLKLTALLKEKQKGIINPLHDCVAALNEEVKASLFATMAESLVNLSGQKEINAIELICSAGISETLALDLLKKTQELKSRNLLIQSGNIQVSALYQTPSGDFDLVRFLAEHYKAPKALPLDEGLLHIPKTRIGTHSIEGIIYTLNAYKVYESLEPNTTALAILSCYTQTSLEAFFEQLIKANAKTLTSKNRWLLSLPTYHATAKTLPYLIPMIEAYARSSKHQLAARLIQQLGTSGITEVYVALDRLNRKMRIQSVKTAIHEAFELGAKLKGVTIDAFGDGLIEDLGFTEQTISLTYCGVDYTLALDNSLKFEIRKPDGKTIKTLPKPKGTDDADIAAGTNKHFTELKKTLREVVTLQTCRLENAFSMNRQWNFSDWSTVFIKNPVMNKLAGQLVWGIYEQGNLMQTFTVNSTPITHDKHVLSLTTGTQIGLIHPLEMVEDEINNWLTYFSKSKICILFNQLSRPSMTVTQDPTDPLTYLLDKTIRKSPNTVINRLRKKGWSIGYVQDAGVFEYIYKSLPGINMYMELTFSDYLWHGGYGYESETGDVGIGNIQFYHLDSINFGYCQRDEINSKNEVNIRVNKDIFPERIVDELFREVLTAYS